MMLVQGGPRLQAWRAALWFEEKFAGRKNRKSIVVKRLVFCSNRPKFCCTPNAIFDSRVIFKFSVCLRLKIGIFWSKKDTQHTNKLTIQFFLGFGYEVNARFNFLGQQTQARMQVSSAILFRDAFQSLSNWESPFAKYEHGEHIFNAKSLKRGQLPGCPTLVAGLVTLHFFQNWFPRSSVVFPVCFFVFDAVMPL